MQSDGTISLPRRLNPRKSYYKANFIAPNTLRAVSRVMAVNIDFRVAPASMDLGDRESAKVAEKVFSHVRDMVDFPAKKMATMLWAAICGAGFQKVTWDPLAGSRTRIYRDPNLGIRGALSPDEEEEFVRRGWYEDIPEGEIDLSVASPFQIYWDWNAREGGIDDCRWLAQIHTDHIESLVDRYGTDIRTKVTPLASDTGAIRYEEAIATLSAGVSGSQMIGADSHDFSERARIVELFERPAVENNGKGRYILAAGDHVIRDESNPYSEHGIDIPFVMYPWWPMPGRFMPLSLVEQLRSPQKAYNRSRSHQHDVERTNGYPLTFLPKDAGVKRTKMISGLPGLILEVNMTKGSPVVTSPPNLPPFIGMNSDRALNELNGISAMASPSKDAYPAGVRSSLAIQAIQEDQNAILTPTVAMIARADRKIGQMILALAGDKYQTPRLIRTVGKGNEFEVEYFAGSEFRGNYDLRIFGEPTRMETSSSFQERLLAMIEIGALDPTSPEGRIATLKAMDARLADEIMSDQLLDEHAEEKWLQRMIRNPGFAAPIIGVEDPNVRIRVLERIMKKDEFWEFDQATQQKIYERWQYFSEKIQEQLQAQIEMQSMMAGAQTREKGTPSAPKRNQTANA